MKCHPEWIPGSVCEQEAVWAIERQKPYGVMRCCNEHRMDFLLRVNVDGPVVNVWPVADFDEAP